jgi:hypothetical protein
MEAQTRWRLAKFPDEQRRAVFVEHAHAMGLDGLEIEVIESNGRVRFRCPARYECGLADMIAAHGGKVMPSPDYPELVPAAAQR